MRVRIECAHDRVAPIGEVRPNPKNPNQHPPEQVQVLVHVLKTHGWRSPVTISTRSGLVVRGHGRLLAAQSMGLTEVPVDDQHYESEEAELQDLIADNESQSLSAMSETALRDLLKDFPGNAMDFGMTLEQLQDLIATPEVSIQERKVYPPPKRVWVLIGIPVESYGSIAQHIETIAAMDETIVESTVGDAPDDEADED